MYDIWPRRTAFILANPRSTAAGIHPYQWSRLYFVSYPTGPLIFVELTSVPNSVSPSVYAVFTGLSAVNLCGTIGPTIALTTLSFGPSELSTSSIPVRPMDGSLNGYPSNPIHTNGFGLEYQWIGLDIH
jgi:hypothetical protein